MARHNHRFLMPALATAALTALAGLPASAVASAEVPDATPADAQKSPPLSQLLADVAKPDLWVESPAPPLQIAEFMRGKPVSSFQSGNVYVVEFWATWCGPCIRAFPHLAELQNHYNELAANAEDGKKVPEVTVIGVNIWEDRNLSTKDRRQLVANFVEEHQEMKYTVALEEGTAMAETWMRAAGRTGIPSAFIVDQQGKIAWMGHPMSMDEPLEKIVEGTWDASELSEELWNSQLVNVAAERIQQASLEGNYDTMIPLARTLVRDHFGDNPGELNFVAWMLVQGDSVPQQAASLGTLYATTAAELTDWENHSILDTLAKAEFHQGNRDRAVELIEKAITLAEAEPDGPNKTQAISEYNQRLAMFNGEG